MMFIANVKITDGVTLIAIPYAVLNASFIEGVRIFAKCTRPCARTHFISAVPLIAGCTPAVMFADGSRTPHVTSGTVVTQFTEPGIVVVGFYVKRPDAIHIPAMLAV